MRVVDRDGWIGSDVADVRRVPLGDLCRAMTADPRVRDSLARILREVGRGGEAVAGFNSSL